MIRHALAPHVPGFARALGISRTLDDLAADRAGDSAADQRPAGAAASPDHARDPLPASGPEAERRRVAITFDDGPHPDGTPQILEILGEHGAIATFFLVGEQVVKRPAVADRIRREGHTVALHGYRHLPHPSRTAGQMADDFARGLAAIEDATGVTPHVHRPPFGVYSPASLRMARERRLKPLLWSSWGRDWRKFTTGEQIASLVARDLEPGAVILLHDADFYSAQRSHTRTAAALPLILRMLKSDELDTVGCA